MDGKLFVSLHAVRIFTRERLFFSMKKFKYITLALLGGLLIFSPAMMAKAQGDRIVWSERQSKKTGLYTTKNYFVTNGVSLSFNAMYYFGDVDNMGVAFNGGFNKENVSYGGSFVFGYLMPVGNHCNMRYTLMGGTLRGNNKEKFDKLTKPRDDYRKFQSVIIQPAVGVEYYPFSNAGFFLYGGIALTASIITNYEFYYYYSTPQGRVRADEPLSGKTFGFLPMIQLGLGYSFRLSQSWNLSLEFMLQEGLIDTHYMNLDAWPLAGSQNNKNIALGNSFGTWVDEEGKKHIHWNDGWFQLGITISYRWRNCEHCRILNNYSNVRGSRR